MSIAAATVKAHADRYKKDFDVVVAYLLQYVEKHGPTMSVNVVSVTQSRPAKRQKSDEAHGTFKGRIELKECSMEQYNSMSAVYKQQF